MNRLIKMSELTPDHGRFRIQILPDGFCLINPTEEEAKVISLYAEVLLKLKPGVPVETQSPNQNETDKHQH